MDAVPAYMKPISGAARPNLSTDILDIIGAIPVCVNETASGVSPPADGAFHLYRILLDVCVVGLLCLLGFVGNGLTIVILRSDRDRNSTTNWLLQSLAVVDIVYLVACVFIQPLKAIHETSLPDWGAEDMELRATGGSQADDGGDYGRGSRQDAAWKAFRTSFAHLEPFIWTLASIAQTITIWVVVLVTVDRYIAICLPLRSKMRTIGRARLAVGVVVFAAVVYNVPLFFEREVRYEKDCAGRETIRTDSTDLRRNTWYFVGYKTVSYFVFRTIGPLLTLIVLNARLIRALRLMRRRHRYLTRRNQQRENVTMTLVVVVSVFIACELPDVCLRFAVTVAELAPAVEIDAEAVLYRALPVTNALLTLNSAVNFLIYCLIGHKFRRILVRMCQSDCECGGVGGRGRMEIGPVRRICGRAIRSGAASSALGGRGGQGGGFASTKQDMGGRMTDFDGASLNGVCSASCPPSMMTRSSIAMTTTAINLTAAGDRGVGVNCMLLSPAVYSACLSSSCQPFCPST